MMGSHDLTVNLLGDIRARVGDVDVELGSVGPRSLFAVLALRPESTVSSEELIHALWGQSPPRTAQGNVYSYVCGIRKAVERAAPGCAGRMTLARSGRGYSLSGPTDVDLSRFEGLSRRAGGLWKDGDHDGALRCCDAALSMWPGQALRDGAGPLLEATRDALQYDKRRLQQLRCCALIETGSAARAVIELIALIGDAVVNEELCELLLVALHECGRRGEAVHAYRRMRHQLVDELGIEPGARLRTVHQRILEGDARDGGQLPSGFPCRAPQGTPDAH